MNPTLADQSTDDTLAGYSTVIGTIEDDEFNTGGIAWDTSKGASQTSADFHIDDLHLVQ